MNKEIELIAAQLRDNFDGDPWLGRSISILLSEISEDIAFQMINGQHSILDLVWHMVTWREFIINRLQVSDKAASYFEENDWRTLDHTDNSLWQKGLDHLQQTQIQLIEIVQQQQDSILENVVPERQYNYRKLLYGIIQHDIYHIAQIAYVTKVTSANTLEEKNTSARKP